MWRFFHGLSRGLRTRTPAPPSQTTPWADESENGSSAKNESNEQTTSVSLTLECAPSNADGHNEPPKCETDRIIYTPSEADLLLREYFGPNWKKNCNGSSGNSNHIQDIWNGIGLGTACLTAIVLGRAVLSSWQWWRRRRAIFSNEALPVNDFEHSYRYNAPTENVCVFAHRLWPSRFHMARLSILPAAFSPSTVLAAGGNTASQPTVRVNSALLDKAKASVRNRTDPLGCGTKRKSVTFQGVGDRESGSCYSGITDEGDSQIPEEVLERFSEDARNCHGSAYNILGLKRARSNDYAGAVSCFEKGSREGHAKSLFNLAVCYQKGLGTKKNINKAMELYDKAAFKGHSLAQNNLAVLLLEKGGTANKIEAIRLLEKAALNGYTKAQSYLSVLFTKSGEFQSFEKAVKLFRKAAENGDAASKYNLGICYENGLGLKQDLSEAFSLYSSAAASKHLGAQFNMAVMLDQGFPGTDRNSKLARELFADGAKQGHKPSMARLAGLEHAKNESSTGDETRLAVEKQNKEFNVYYSSGKVKPERSTVIASGLCRDGNKKERRIYPSEEIGRSRQTKIEEPVVPDLLSISSQISALSLINGANTGVVPLGSSFLSGSADICFQSPYIPIPATDSLFDQAISNPSKVMGLRRASTSPANLCFYAPIVEKTAGALPLEA